MKQIFEDKAGRYVEGKQNTRYYEQNCERCGDGYFPKRRGVQKYCSQSCNVRACRERNGYETLDGVQVSKGKAAMLGQMEAIEKKLDALGGKTMGVNTEMVKSAIAGNAIYDAGKAVVKSLFGPEDEVKKINKKLDGIEAKLANLQLSPGQRQTRTAPTMVPTGSKFHFPSPNGIVYVTEFSDGQTIILKVDKIEELPVKTPKKINLLNL